MEPISKEQWLKIFELGFKKVREKGHEHFKFMVSYDFFNKTMKNKKYKREKTNETKK